MMSPKNERVRMIAAFTEAAVHLLDDPIDMIEITGTRAVVRAGRHTTCLTLSYNGGTDDRGAAMPGSGHWVAHELPNDDGVLPSAKAQSWWRKLWRPRAS